MYIGFEIDGNKFHINNSDNYREIALENYNKKQKIIKNQIKDFFEVRNGEIQVKSIEKLWFPKVKNHVFLSHSHADERQALILAGYLMEHCKVDVFIDSCIWKYSDDLLKLLDKKFCEMENGNYNYKRRNITTTQVHLVLNMALAKMINNTECFMFFKTDNSVCMKKDFSSKETESPWICDELLMASLIARRSKEMHRKEYRMGDLFSINESQQYIPRFIYDISFFKMNCLNYTQLMDIANTSHKNYSDRKTESPAEQFLDLLYETMNINEMETFYG